MLTFDFILGLTLFKNLILNKIKETKEENRSREKSKRKVISTTPAYTAYTTYTDNTGNTGNTSNTGNTGNTVLEEIILMPRFRYKTVVFLCAQGLDCREVMFQLVRLHPQLYSVPTMYTNRPPKPEEVNGTQYTFVTRRQMVLHMREKRFLEHETYNDHFYGVKMGSIRTIHQDGKMALVEIKPQSVQKLFNPEFAPFVIFIAPPVLEGAPDLDGSIARINKESDEMRRDFDHLIDMTIVMNNMRKTVAKLEMVLADIVRSPQWVPSAWVFYRPPQCCRHR